MYSSWIMLFVASIRVYGQDPAVILPQGRIVGIKVYPKNSINPVEIFLGIPYAIAPTGRYRFSRADTNSLPVVIILYSESWSQAGVTSLPCEELAAEGVVVVTVSYRLHLLGLFTLRSILARGSLPLLDQYLALLWIRENIAAFGGDPTAITLLGHSAGADSVLHHIASQRSAGLFQRAIVMSPRYILRAIDDNNSNVGNEVEKISREMAHEIGCSGSDENILHCLRDQPLAVIMRTYQNSNWSNVLQPVPDIFLPESEQYLPKSLPTALSSTNQPTAQLDLLLGATDLEAINFNHEDYEVLSERGLSHIMEYATSKAIPELLQSLSIHASEAYFMLTEAVRWEFWGVNSRGQISKAGSLRAAECLARAQSSAKWGVGTALLAARFARKFSRLHVYSYTQPAGVDLFGRHKNFTGAAHGTDLVALLGDAMLLQVTRRQPTVGEQRVSSLMQRYVINFVKFGSPAQESEWPRYKAGEAYVKDIKDSAHFCEEQTGRHVAFWLQYLPHLSDLLSSPERTEQLILTAGESRLRGGMFALCGVSVVLLMLLCACAILLRWERVRRRRSMDTVDNYDTPN